MYLYTLEQRHPILNGPSISENSPQDSEDTKSQHSEFTSHLSVFLPNFHSVIITLPQDVFILRLKQLHAIGTNTKDELVK